VTDNSLLNFVNEEHLFTVGRDSLLLHAYRRQDVLEISLA